MSESIYSVLKFMKVGKVSILFWNSWKSGRYQFCFEIHESRGRYQFCSEIHERWGGTFRFWNSWKSGMGLKIRATLG